jgi:hypothetical protein
MSRSYDDYGVEPLDSLCHAWHGDEGFTAELQAAVNLYAAAPELLAAVRDLLAAITVMHPYASGGGEYGNIVTHARAAIAMAEGVTR